MPRWPNGATSTRKTCPHCGGKKDFYAEMCRACRHSRGEWPTPLAGVTGEDHPTWKGGQHEDEDGYLRTYAPEHPWPRRCGYLYEHVRVVELHVGRRMRPSEAVHHVDGDKQNNDISNLRIMDRGAHSRLHRMRDIHNRERDDRGRFA